MIAVEPGKKVAVLSLGGVRGATVTLATVQTVGKRDIVLDDGQRFSISRQTRHQGDALLLLCEINDPHVFRTQRNQQIRCLTEGIIDRAAAIRDRRSPNPVASAARLAEFAVRLTELVGFPQEQATP